MVRGAGGGRVVLALTDVTFGSANQPSRGAASILPGKPARRIHSPDDLWISAALPALDPPERPLSASRSKARGLRLALSASRSPPPGLRVVGSASRRIPRCAHR